MNPLRLSRRGPGVPATLRGRPHRRSTIVMRPWDWAVPPRCVDLEIISAVPAGWDEAPPGQRKPPLLFIHGMESGAWAFAERWMAGALRRGYPAYALSLRGHGNSGGHDRRQITLFREYIADILQAIITLPEPPVLVGHSMGALLAQEVASRYPARGLVLVAPAPAYGVVGNALAQLRHHPVGALRSLLAGSGSPEMMFATLDPDRARAYADRMAGVAPITVVQLLQSRTVGPVFCPVAVVGAKEDALIRPQDIKHTAAMYGVRPIWLPGAGHEVMLDAGAGVSLDIILDWVDSDVVVGRDRTATTTVR